MNRRTITTRGNTGWVAALCWLVFATSGLAQQEEAATELRDGFLIRVPLPITGEDDVQLEATIERVLERLPVAKAANERPVLVLQFDTSRGASGRGSQFERCIGLARFLTSEKLNRFQTIAYVPGPASEDQPAVALSGHALLVALACEQRYMDEGAKIGSAGLDEPVVDPLILEAYRTIAARRGSMPEPVVMGLVDKSRGIYRVEELDGSLSFVGQAELLEMEQTGKVAVIEPLLEPGEIADFSADLLFRYQLIEQQVRDRRDLAARLGVRPDSLEGDPSLRGQWNPIAIKLEGPIDQKQVTWILAALEQQLAKDVNLIIVEINSQGGSFRDAARLSQRLADISPLEVRTVAYVTEYAQGPAALVALSCHHLVLAKDGLIGGAAQPEFGQDNRDSLSEMVPELAARTGRDAALITALVDPQTQLQQYTHIETGERRLWTEEAWNAAEFKADWLLVGDVPTQEGLDANAAGRLFVTRYVVEDRSELYALYQLDGEPELLQPTATFRGIERFARFLASPWIAWWLLFGGMIFLSSEMSSPGLGIPGFLAAVCFMLFFWAQYLDGNAHWLEIMLFGLGALCLALEIFVVPGFGVFGLGGLAMMLISIVLASQTFIWPTTSEEFSRLPVSLSMVLALVLGVAVPMILIPHYLDRLPILRRLSLNPAVDRDFEHVNQREAINQLEYLNGKMGMALTPLVPGGKVKFGDDVYSVVTDGRAVESGTKVVVREVRGNHVLVEPLDI